MRLSVKCRKDWSTSANLITYGWFSGFISQTPSSSWSTKIQVHTQILLQTSSPDGNNHADLRNGLGQCQSFRWPLARLSVNCLRSKQVSRYRRELGPALYPAALDCMRKIPNRICSWLHRHILNCNLTASINRAVPSGCVILICQWISDFLCVRLWNAHLWRCWSSPLFCSHSTRQCSFSRLLLKGPNTHWPH